MCEFVPRQKDQPIKALALRSFDELTMFGPRKPKLHHLGRPILNNSPAEGFLVHVGADVIAPARRKLVKLVVRCRCVTIRIALKVGKANVDDYVDTFELG